MKVSLKLERDMLLIKLDETRSFYEQSDELKDYLMGMKGFLKNGEMKVGYDLNSLSYEEELRLCDIVDEAFGKKVNFCYKTKAPQSVLRHITANGEVFLKKVYGIVRAGECIKSNGDIMVIGDVNPTAMLVAKGDIFVMGTLKGSAHAGCDGNTEAVIYAKNMKPEILRIASVAGYADGMKNSVENCMAKVENGVITVKMM